MVTLISCFLRSRRSRTLAKQIAQLHPELDGYQGEEKIDRYAVLAFRLVLPPPRSAMFHKPAFNYTLADQSPWLRDKVFVHQCQNVGLRPW